MAVKANEILAYKGDSALAGGMGAAGTQQVITGVWKMHDAMQTGMQQMRAMRFQRQQKEYEQRIKDRDEIGNMISSGELATDQMEDEDRIRIRDGAAELQKSFIDVAKKGITDEDYLNIKKSYADLKNQATIAKTNYLAIKADEKLNAELYDQNAPKKTISRTTSNKDASGNESGTSVTVQETLPGENVRRESYNQKAWENHIAEQRELMKKDPSHKYEPFVPISKIDESKIFAGAQVKTDTKKVGYKQETTTTPDFGLTSDYYIKMYADPDSRKQMMIARDEFLSGGKEADIVIDGVNKKLESLFPDQPLMRINAATAENLPMFFSLLNYAQGYESAKTKKLDYANKVDASVDEERQKAQIQGDKEIRVDNKKTANQIRQYQETIMKNTDGSSSNSKVGMDAVTMREIYKQRSQAILDATMGDADKAAALKALEAEIFRGALIKDESGGNPKAVSPKGAFGAMQLMPETAKEVWKEVYPKEAFSKEKAMDPKRNVELGGHYMGKMLEKYNFDVAKAHAAYNMGPGALDEVIRLYGDNWIDFIPKETKDRISEMAKVEVNEESIDAFMKRVLGPSGKIGEDGKIIPSGKKSADDFLKDVQRLD